MYFRGTNKSRVLHMFHYLKPYITSFRNCTIIWNISIWAVAVKSWIMQLWYMTPCSVVCGYQLHGVSHCPHIYLYTEKAGNIFLRSISMIMHYHNPKGNKLNTWQLRLQIPLTDHINVIDEQSTLSLNQIATYSGKAGAIFILKI
jgi:hypothetical protein